MSFLKPLILNNAETEAEATYSLPYYRWSSVKTQEI